MRSAETAEWDTLIVSNPVADVLLLLCIILGGSAVLVFLGGYLCDKELREDVNRYLLPQRPKAFAEKKARKTREKQIAKQEQPNCYRHRANPHDSDTYTIRDKFGLIVAYLCKHCGAHSYNNGETWEWDETDRWPEYSNMVLDESIMPKPPSKPLPAISEDVARRLAREKAEAEALARRLEREKRNYGYDPYPALPSWQEALRYDRKGRRY